MFGYINLTRVIYAQMKARGHGVIVNDIGAAGEKFDFNYIAAARQRRVDGVHARARRQKPRGQHPRCRHQSRPCRTDRLVTLMKTQAQEPVLGDESHYTELQNPFRSDVPRTRARSAT